MPKQRIVLHIGHGKTGTSATQRFFAKHANFMRTKGILYPDHPSLQRALEGGITSGNVSIPESVIKEQPQTEYEANWFETEIIDQVRRMPDYQTYVFSNEMLFRVFDTILSKIADLEMEYEFAVILSVRNPLEMLASAYGQVVKHHGFYGEISDYEPHEKDIVRAESHLREIKRLGISVDVLNYSYLGQEISKEIFRISGLSEADINSLDLYSKTHINRSLTKAEMQLVKGVNKCFGARLGEMCSDALVENLADIPSEKAFIPHDVIERFKIRVSDSVAFVNEFLANDQKLRMDLVHGPFGNSTLSNRQIEVVFETLEMVLCNERDRAVAERDRAVAERDRAVAERNHAIKYPWKYIKKAVRQRQKKFNN